MLQDWLQYTQNGELIFPSLLISLGASDDVRQQCIDDEIELVS